MDVSVIICTYNRCENLRRTLAAFRTQTLPPGVSWELLVVDNGSTDVTDAVCREFAGQLPVRHLLEPKLGKSHALNRSLIEARGDVLLFTDDDVTVSETWIRECWDAGMRHPHAAFWGGRVIPDWEVTPTKWLRDYSRTPALMGPMVHLDYGDVEGPPDPRWPTLFFGANLVIRRAALDQARLTFRTDLGPRGREYSTHEDMVLLHQLQELGHAGVYVPAAVVHHRNAAMKMTERHVRAWHKGRGRSEVRLGHWPVHGRSVFGAPLELWSGFVRAAVAYGVTRFIRPAPTWLDHEARMARRWGAICEFRAMASGIPASEGQTRKSEVASDS